MSRYIYISVSEVQKPLQWMYLVMVDATNVEVSRVVDVLATSCVSTSSPAMVTEPGPGTDHR